MKFNFITIMVRDIEKSILFYQQVAGLDVVRRFDAGAGEIAFLANAQGETMLELIGFEMAEKVSAKGMVLSFEADEDLAILHSRIKGLGYAVSEIIADGPKPAHFTVTDPDGLVIEIGV